MPTVHTPAKDSTTTTPERKMVPAETSAAHEAAFEGFSSPSASSPEQDKARRLREHLERKLTRLEQTLENTTEASVVFWQGCATRLTSLASDYEKLYLEVLESSAEFQFETEEQAYAAFESRQFHLSLKIEQRIAAAGKVSSSSVRIRLPEIRLPTFDGSFEAWLAFSDAFKSLIDSNTGLSDVDKLAYLKGALVKDAQRLIGDIDCTAANYSVAWKLLEGRYQNKKLVVKRYLDALFGIAAVKRETYDSLINLMDGFERNVSAIRKMEVNTDGWSVLLGHMLYSRLDASTQKQWEAHYRSVEVPTYEKILEFLNSHVMVLQATSSNSSRNYEQPAPKPDDRRKPKCSEVYAVNSSTNSCAFCGQPYHTPFKCDVFSKLSVQERYNRTKVNKLCINCLSPGHVVKNCASSSCRVCNLKHHTMLHKESVSESAEKRNSYSDPDEIPSAKNSASVLLTHSENPTTILLPTALVKIQAPNGTLHWARALLDGGAQINLATERLCQRLQVPRQREHHAIGAVGRSRKSSSHSVCLSIESHCSDYKANWKFHVLPELTWDLPTSRVEFSRCTIPGNCTLADPKFFETSPIDLLVGREAYNDLMMDGIIRLKPDNVMLQNTAFGWIVSGKVNLTHAPTLSIASVVCSTQDLEQQLSRFWEIESCQSPSTLSIEETACEQQFAATVTRDPAGRFVVPILAKRKELVKLGNSLDIAHRRLDSLWRRLKANPELKVAYKRFLDEYAELGHMEQVKIPKTSPTPTYFLPHHCILRPDSMTTKLRVVFDASCATDSGTSLNDVLMTGPVVQEDLVGIMLRFRVPKYVIIADIEKMYRQIWIRDTDRPLQQILWKDDPDGATKLFQLKTITYGTSSAPYLATKCLQELAERGKKDYPIASKIVERDFYMDDLITGVDTILEGNQLCEQLVTLLSSAGFTLRKWASNCSSILQNIPTEQHEQMGVYQIDKDTCIKTLGLKWTPVRDELSFSVPEWKTEEVPTKRKILSDSARLFDPLGLSGPVIVIAKLFMQELWAAETPWDEPLDESLQHRWKRFREELAVVKTFTIPRRVVNSNHHIEIHGFSDASLKAYGACIYIRSISEDGTISVNLLCAKSKIAPLPNRKSQKTVTLPRLELSGALLLAHLWEKVKKSFQSDPRCIFWVDSTIVLHWLASSPSRWKQFVANRVSEIQHLTEAHNWQHVAGEQNPADIISRGMMPSQLLESNLWWHGPDWLSQPTTSWPIQHPIEQAEEKYLEERAIVHAVQEQPCNEIFGFKSSFFGLVRLVAYLQRFSYNCKSAHRKERRNGCLRTDELQTATQTLVRIAQQESFTEDLKCIQNSKQVKSNSKLKSLAPIMVDGILRVGGRLRNAAISRDRKHPIILATHHPLTRLIMHFYHKNLLHAGPQLLISAIREKFWPLRARNLARKIVHECIQCFKCKPTALEQVMGDLPPERVTPTFPFSNTGIDLCGPLFYRTGQRKSKPVKCYVTIFVCMTTKAVHIELVADLSSAAFLATLKRFVARRGKPSIIECDNAKNFRGADRMLKELHQQFKEQQFQHAVSSYCGSQGITFKFIPPRSPHFGGLWESAVKSFKGHLKATIGAAVLHKDDLETIIVQIESCLNSRPLTPLSSDPDDLEIITPGHFLIHRPLAAIPEPSYEELPANRLDRYQQTQEYLRRIWKRWSTDYLSGLQPRTKWTTLRDNIAIGTMVLLKEDNQPPLKWCYGRVTHIFKGDDGNIRVVNVKTRDGEYRRAINKICILPVQ